MKTTKLMRCALYAAVLAAFGLVGCEKLDLYSIDAPSDLRHRIDSIAAAKPNTGDTTYVTIATAIVGAENNSSGWWTAFSDYFTIPSNKLLHLEFINHGTGVNNWNNWNLGVTNAIADRTAATYKEYFVLRADAWGWGTQIQSEHSALTSHAFQPKGVSSMSFGLYIPSFFHKTVTESVVQMQMRIDQVRHFQTFRFNEKS